MLKIDSYNKKVDISVLHDAKKIYVTTFPGSGSINKHIKFKQVNGYRLQKKPMSWV